MADLSPLTVAAAHRPLITAAGIAAAAAVLSGTLILPQLWLVRKQAVVAETNLLRELRREWVELRANWAIVTMLALGEFSHYTFAASEGA